MKYYVASLMNNDFDNLLGRFFERYAIFLPPKNGKHLTIKAPFNTQEISSVERIVRDFSRATGGYSVRSKGFANFDNKFLVIKVKPSDNFLENYLVLLDRFTEMGIDLSAFETPSAKVFHITLINGSLEQEILKTWGALRGKEISFNYAVDNICILEKRNGTLTHRTYLLR
jgi:2'-5' RNA ligase